MTERSMDAADFTPKPWPNCTGSLHVHPLNPSKPKTLKPPTLQTRQRPISRGSQAAVQEVERDVREVEFGQEAQRLYAFS